jgi:tRNA pseudouridine38-40 synthase
MVRIMVGTLVEIGMGKRAPDVIPAMLEARSREAAGPTAPAHGLFLHWIQFEPQLAVRIEDRG